jgi:hypothetical protein
MGHPTIFGLCAHIDQVYFFTCDFIDIVKGFQAKLYHFYTNPYTKLMTQLLMNSMILKCSLIKIYPQVGVHT